MTSCYLAVAPPLAARLLREPIKRSNRGIITVDKSARYTARGCLTFQSHRLRESLERLVRQLRTDPQLICLFRDPQNFERQRRKFPAFALRLYQIAESRGEVGADYIN